MRLHGHLVSLRTPIDDASNRAAQKHRPDPSIRPFRDEEAVLIQIDFEIAYR